MQRFSISQGQKNSLMSNTETEKDVRKTELQKKMKGGEDFYRVHI